MKMYMHMSLAKGGSIYIWEAVDYPGLCVSDNRPSRGQPVKRTIVFGEKEYPTIAAAVEAAKDHARQQAAPAEAPADHAVRCSTHGHILDDAGVCCSCGAAP